MSAKKLLKRKGDGSLWRYYIERKPLNVGMIGFSDSIAG